ncbi:MAG: hypothetical protein II351_02375 [Clostridia bacterium]|nr:hypothetical protein [Clostridia bacterium]
MKLSFVKCRHLPSGKLAQELFSDAELRALLSQYGYYLTATCDRVDYFAFPARLGLSPHPALNYLEAVRFLPENASVGTAGYFVIGVSEEKSCFVCPDKDII